ASVPTTKVLLYKDTTDKTYPVLIDAVDIDASAKDEASARDFAEKTIASLYSGAESDTRANILAIFTDADASDDEIIEGGTYSEPTTEENAKALLYQIKNFAKHIKKGATDVNPSGLKVKAPRVGLLLPVDAQTGIEVYAKLSAENVNYTDYNVDDVFTYIVETGETAEIYVFDERYVQAYRRRKDTYEEQPIKGTGGSTNAYLTTFRIYAGCPLFSCVRLSEAD
ncbi:MAG: hypothetical protein MJ072_00425, partial [Clostridia bacterium]|nr:hypothetical protein [Clostridia bacterium]